MTTMPAPRQKLGTLHGVVLDCPDPRSLATFYEDLLGMIRVQDEPDWVVIGDAPDRPGLAFQQVADPDSWQPTSWPDPERPQYRHFDVRVDDLAAAEPAVLALGATRLADGGDSFTVYADPAGHPFCLVTM